MIPLILTTNNIITRFCFPPAGQEKDERGVGEQDAGDKLNVMVKIMCYCILQLSCWWQTVGNITAEMLDS